MMVYRGQRVCARNVAKFATTSLFVNSTLYNDTKIIIFTSPFALTHDAAKFHPNGTCDRCTLKWLPSIEDNELKMSRTTNGLVCSG